MLTKWKRKLGYLKRGLLGFFQNNFIKTPSIPKEIKSFTIGNSVQGQPILCFQIGNGPRKFLYTAGIHGNEIGTVKLMHHFINWAHKNHALLSNFTLFIIPCINPDGYHLARRHPDYFKGGLMGRFNANQVDLNRNFDTPDFKQKSEWSFGKDYAEKVDVYCGEYGGSEPEVKALTEFIKNKKIQTLFMFHNAGRDVMGNSLPQAQKLAKQYAEKTGFQFIKEGHWKKLQQTGTAAEWCDLNHVAYIEIEGYLRWGSDWKKQKEAIKASLFAINL
ncbi:MAG: M14 family zinc carboxypeptidase [Candidatus Gracilibacteria bacterium]